MKIHFKVLFACIILASCKGTVPCTKSQIIPIFVGFSSSDLQKVTLKRFVKGSSFAQLIDSTVIIRNSPDSNQFFSFSDTTIIDFNPICCTPTNLVPEYDWTLVTNKNYFISFSDIDSPAKDTICYKCTCLNPINSFVENGQKIIPTRYLYLHKSLYGDYARAGYVTIIK